MNKKNLRVFSLFSLIVISLVSLVYALGTNSVHLTTPENGTWWNDESNYTRGFVFNWTDTGDTSYNTSFCVLYINTSDTGLIEKTNVYRNLSSVNRSIPYTITMNKSFPTGTSPWRVYYTIQCCNGSATPNCWYPIPARHIILDNDTIPSLVVNNQNFVNVSWNNTGEIWFNYTATDSGELLGEQLNVSIINWSNDDVLTSILVDNATTDRITYTVSDGNYTIGIRVADPANNTNTSGPYVVYMDATSPTVSFTNPTLANDTSQSATHVYVNMSITESHFDKAIINFDGVNYYTVGWTSYDDTESSQSGDSLGNATDETWTTYASSNASQLKIYENYTDHTNTDFAGLSQIEWIVQFNVTNSSGKIEVLFYNISNGIWILQYTNDTNTSADGFPVNETITVSTYTSTGWSSWNDAASEVSGGANAYDDDWTTYVNSTSAVVLIHENYTDHTNTNFAGLNRIEFTFQINMTNSSAQINVSFYNYSSGIWTNYHTNSTSVAKVNYTITAITGLNHFANATDPFQVRINLSNDYPGNNGTARYYEGRARFHFNRTVYANTVEPFQILTNISNIDNGSNGTAKYYEGMARFNVNRCSGNINCYYNFTNIGDKKDIKYNVTVNDSGAGNTGTTATRYVSIDTTSPVISEAYNWTYSNSIINFRIRTNDTTASTGTVRVYDRDGTLRTNITATLEATVVNGDTNFTGTIEGDNVSIEGVFRVEYNITDELSNSVQYNMTGIYTKLYDGWNLIGYAGANGSGVGKEIHEICTDTQYCTQMSYFYNAHANKSFATYSTSTPSVNNGTRVQPGDAVHIYLSSDSYILSKDERPSPGDTTGPVSENITVSDGGWNTMGLITAGNMTSVWNATNTTGSKPITYVSYINQSAETYYTCRKSINLCAGTSTTPTNIQLYEGWAVWILTTINSTINRSTIS